MNPAWRTLYSALESFREEALMAIRRSQSSNAQVRSNLLMRYEERDKFIGFIDSYLQGITMARVELIRAIAEMNGHYGEAAEDLVAALER